MNTGVPRFSSHRLTQSGLFGAMILLATVAPHIAHRQTIPSSFERQMSRQRLRRTALATNFKPASSRARSFLMRKGRRFLFLITVALMADAAGVHGQGATAPNQPAQLDVRVAGERSIRFTVKPVSFTKDFPDHPSIAPRSYPAPALTVRDISKPVQKRVGTFTVEVRGTPLTVSIKDGKGRQVQEIVFET